ncbi:MAG: RNA-binding transcriptional accessory protein [Clostridia bacterium]|nr:RNA-binding transcriptional accessory protein [Clostridia bacterium]
MDIKAKLADEFGINPKYAGNIVDLIDDGNTIPFIARYRKEMHGAQTDELIRDFADRLNYLRNLEKRKEEVAASIMEQGKWTDELAIALATAVTLAEVEDIYRPYKQKRKTRASVAMEKGLTPLADAIFAQEAVGDLETIASAYINAEKGVETANDALAGASDIIAEYISDSADLRKSLREFIGQNGVVSSEKANGAPEDKLPTYEMYLEYSEPVSKIPSHRILALNRGEKEDCLKVTVSCDEEACLEKVYAYAVKEGGAYSEFIKTAGADSFYRLIFPALERELRSCITERAEESAIKAFENNLKPLLMQPPLKNKIILGVDPAYRTGCKLAVIDTSGNHLWHGVIMPTPPHNQKFESARIVKDVVKRFKVDVIAIGNGTASKETEIFIAELLPELDREVMYAMVNEAGASVYSASKLGTEEFPDYGVEVRSAISIARRLQDPLAELIKIDVKSIGVGQYQHDMPHKRLDEVLGGVVEDCVNSVGVDLNTASPSLLSYVAGLNSTVSKNIAEYRKTKLFTDRAELLKVSKLGPKAYEQCAGFLRILGGSNPYDATAVHPESYEALGKLLARYGYTSSDILHSNLGGLKSKVEAEGYGKVAEEIGVGEITLRDIVEDVMRPGRDIREDLPMPVLRSDLLSLEDLKEGMELGGVVRNVIDFGVFVDIGVHQDGLVHVSEITDGYISAPSDVLSVGQHVRVKVLGVDVKRGRISLSMKQASGAVQLGAPRRTRQLKGQKTNDRRRDNRNGKDRRENNLDDKLSALAAKFNKFKK